jgi:hypothetical protein
MMKISGAFREYEKSLKNKTLIMQRFFFQQWQCEYFVVYFARHQYLRPNGVAGDWRIESNLEASGRGLMEPLAWRD